MIYEIGNRQIDTKRTQVKLNSTYAPDHEYIQFIENYARAMFEENWNMAKLHFYISDPAKGNSEVSVEDALDQLNSGYPIFVKHEDSPEVLPFMKREDKIYTGDDFNKVEKHPELNIGFDYEEFMNSPAVARPSIWQYILGIFGLGDGSYTEYQTYKQKLEIVRSSEYHLKKSVAENDGYKYASELYEYSNIADDISRIAETPVTDLMNPVKKESAPEISDEEVIAGDTLNIGEAMKAAAPSEASKATPQVPEAIQQELDARQADIEKHEAMKESKFMKDVIHEILLNPEASEEDLLRGVDFVRTIHKDVPSEISTQEYIDYARTIILTDTKRYEANESMEAYKAERFNRLGDSIARAITDQLVKEQEGLNPEETYKTVRFGPTLKKMMTANPTYPARLAAMGKEDPEKLTGKYKVQAEKDAKKAQKQQKPVEAQKEVKEAIKADEKVLS